jgi:hypothetical protein
LAFLGVLAGLFVLGIVFIWYLLLFGFVALLVRRVYLFFTKPPVPQEPVPYQSDKVVAGDFRRSPGRVIEHEEKE